MVDVNLSGVFYSLRAEVEVMLQGGGGSIINMASIYGLVGMPVNIAYTAAKHGVVGITRAAALAYAAQGIRINAVAPAVIETPLLLKSPEDVSAQIVATHPIGRIGQIHEVAELVAFLASDRSSFCTGGVYPVDGGLHRRLTRPPIRAAEGSRAACSPSGVGTRRRRPRCHG